MDVRDCSFCRENGNLEGNVLAQNEHCYLVETGDAVLQHAGMIIPHRHVATPFELREDEWLATMNLLQKARKLLEGYGPEGYNIGWNVGKVAGQSVPHAHLHVIARFSDEPLAGKGMRYAFKQPSNRRP